MAPYVSLPMQCFEMLPDAPAVVRLLVPLEGLALYERPGAQWMWLPSEGDAVDLSKTVPGAFLETLGLKGVRPPVKRDHWAPRATSVLNYPALSK